MAGRLVFRQLFESKSCTYTYIVGCARTRQALIIDPVRETVERDVEVSHAPLQIPFKTIRQLDLNLLYALNTHVHADHITGTHGLRKLFPSMKSVLSTASGGKADLFVAHHDSISVGDKSLQVRSTPGHTNGCVTYVLDADHMAFTGDALLFRGCGRTDFQEGDASRLYESCWSEILSLPDHFLLYMGHDYQGHTVTSVQEEKKYNTRLTRTREQFILLMNNLNLPRPAQIDSAVPLNLRDGEES